MKKTEVYKRNYVEEGEFYKLKEDIKNNFHIDQKYNHSEMYEYVYMTIEENVLITLSLKFDRWDTNSHYKAEIYVEKVGKEISKVSEIETLLQENGFKKDQKIKKNIPLF